MGGATSVALNEDEARVVYRELRREYAEQYASRALTPGEQKRMLSALAAKLAVMLDRGDGASCSAAAAASVSYDAVGALCIGDVVRAAPADGGGLEFDGVVLATRHDDGGACWGGGGGGGVDGAPG